MKSTLLTGAITLLAGAQAATYNVTVGPGLSYSPDTVTANQGDIISFIFGSGHDVVSGSFGSPCQPNGNIYSGEPNDGDVYSVTVNTTDPIWIYCSVPQHCQNGMVMVINPGSDQTLDSYKSAAASSGSSSAPNAVVGGVSGIPESSSSASSSAASGPSSAATSVKASMSSSASRTASSSATSASSTTSSSSSSRNNVSNMVFLATVVIAAGAAGFAL